MALKMNFREVTPEDTEILRMIALRNGIPFPKSLPGWRAMSKNENKSACPP